MRTDAFLDFQRTANANQAITATAFSGDWLDQLARRSLGDGEGLGGLRLATTIGTTFAATHSSEAVTLTDTGDLVTFENFTTVDADITVGTDIFAETAHGLETGDALYVASTGSFPTTSPAGLLAANTKVYAIAASADTFKVATTRANALAGTAIDVTVNTGGATLTWTQDHEIPVGTPVVLDTIVDTSGVTEGTIYYTSFSASTTHNILVLAPTLADALLGTNIVAMTTDGTAALTTLNTLEVQLVLAGDSSGPGDEELQVVGSSGPITIREARNIGSTHGSDQIDLVGHGMTTGTPVTFAGGDLPAGLTAGTRYFVIDTGDDAFQVASSRENAFAGIAVATTDDGTGEMSVTIADGLLSANGPVIYTPINCLAEDIGERYLRVRYVVGGGDFTAGAVRSHMVHTADLSPKNYPIGYEVL